MGKAMCKDNLKQTLCWLPNDGPDCIGEELTRAGPGGRGS